MYCGMYCWFGAGAWLGHGRTGLALIGSASCGFSLNQSHQPLSDSRAGLGGSWTGWGLPGISIATGITGLLIELWRFPCKSSLYIVLQVCLPWTIKRAGPSRPAYMRCWLCEYSDDPVARSLAKYISEQAVVMGPELMSERVHEVLIDKCAMCDGIGLDDVREHIMTHTLCPSVRAACIMRSLLKLSDKLEGITTSTDPDTGQTVVEAKNVTVYLKVISEVMQMYRTGEVSRLLFAPETKGV